MRVRFSAPVQTGPGAHPASCTMGTGSFLGVKRPVRGADHPPPSSAEVEGRVELYLYSPSGPSWPVIGRTFAEYYSFDGRTYVHVYTHTHACAHAYACCSMENFTFTFTFYCVMKLARNMDCVKFEYTLCTCTYRYAVRTAQRAQCTANKDWSVNAVYGNNDC